MARIVLGIGTSHGPMLVTTPQEWLLRLPDDRNNLHPWRGQIWDFGALVNARTDEDITAALALPEQQARAARCTAAIDRLADVLEEHRIDVAVIVGNDQMEIFNDTLIPAFSILHGDEIVNAPFDDARMARLPPGIRESITGYIPPNGATYAAAGAFGRHLISAAIAAEFDVASMTAFPKRETPHAYGFVYRQLMRDAPMLSVPVVLNTFYPPNQPTVGRCVAFGRVMRRAIESWPGSERVALIASGGLSHFVVDEALDQQMLDWMAAGDMDSIAAVDETVFQSGTSEIKNWVPVAAAMADLGLKMTVADYVPIYRSLAGTGNAMGFVYWTDPTA